jgi:hypothetical protein
MDGAQKLIVLLHAVVHGSDILTPNGKPIALPIKEADRHLANKVARELTESELKDAPELPASPDGQALTARVADLEAQLAVQTARAEAAEKNAESLNQSLAEARARIETLLASSAPSPSEEPPAMASQAPGAASSGGSAPKPPKIKKG